MLLKNTIEKEVNKLSTVLDEIVSITGSEIYDEIKKTNLKMCQNALRRDMKANARKSLS